MTDRIHLFANGTQYMDWTANNCDRCTKAGDPSESGSSTCPLFEAIYDAAADDGTVSAEVARRLGTSADDTRYVWRCLASELKPDVAEQARAWVAAVQVIHPVFGETQAALL